jgi:hypothetical protein
MEAEGKKREGFPGFRYVMGQGFPSQPAGGNELPLGSVLASAIARDEKLR